MSTIEQICIELLKKRDGTHNRRHVDINTLLQICNGDVMKTLQSLDMTWTEIRTMIYHMPRDYRFSTTEQKEVLELLNTFEFIGKSSEEAYLATIKFLQKDQISNDEKSTIVKATIEKPTIEMNIKKDVVDNEDNKDNFTNNIEKICEGLDQIPEAILFIETYCKLLNTKIVLEHLCDAFDIIAKKRQRTIDQILDAFTWTLIKNVQSNIWLTFFITAITNKVSQYKIKLDIKKEIDLIESMIETHTDIIKRMNGNLNEITCLTIKHHQNLIELYMKYVTKLEEQLNRF